MSIPNYSTWTDEQVLTSFTESLESAYTDASGTEDDRWRAVANAALDDTLRTPLGIEALKRKRKWGQPITTPVGEPPPTITIANPDRLAIV